MVDDPDAKEYRVTEQTWFTDFATIDVSKVNSEIHYDDAGTACIKDQLADQHVSWYDPSGWKLLDVAWTTLLEHDPDCEAIPGQPYRSHRGSVTLNKVWFDNDSFPACSGTVNTTHFDVYVTATVFAQSGSVVHMYNNAAVQCSAPFNNLDDYAAFEKECKKHC